jgi:hypothetical protein
VNIKHGITRLKESEIGFVKKNNFFIFVFDVSRAGSLFSFGTYSKRFSL